MGAYLPSAIELQLRAVIDSAPSGLLMTDAAGRIVLVNRQVEGMFGYAREELLGRPVEMLIPSRFRPTHPDQRATFLAEPRVRAMGHGRELHGLRSDGTEVPLEIGLTPLATDQGMLVLATVVDISARRRAEERFRIAVESSPSGMLMIDRDGRLVLVNREIERMFGYTREEILGQSIELLVPEPARTAHPAHRLAFYAHPDRRSMGDGRDLFGVRKDGTRIPLEIGLNPIETDEGLFVLGSVVDISGRTAAEQERRRLEEELRQAQKMEAIGRLASGIAHDFNNLLMGIIGCGGLIKRSLADDHSAHPLVDDLCAAAKRGASLTRDLLDFSRRNKPSDLVPTQLNAVVQVAERMLRQVIGEDIHLEVDLCESGGSLRGNPTHLEHVLVNLIVNARDAMPHGGRLRVVTRDVELAQPLATRGRVLPPASYVVLEVSDTGTGMDPATQERLFEPFFTTKEPSRGTGLGLYTVYTIVEQLGGGIDFESGLGQGTRFTIHFPRDMSLTRAVPAPRAPLHALTSNVARGAPRILVVEDERLIRTTLRHLLSAHGYEILVAENAQQALELARDSVGPIDLLLSDVVLPDGSGPELAKILASEGRTPRSLFMSAYPTALLVQQGRVLPGTRTLEKPFDEHVLYEAVRAALGTDADHTASTRV